MLKNVKIAITKRKKNKKSVAEIATLIIFINKKSPFKPLKTLNNGLIGGLFFTLNLKTKKAHKICAPYNL